MTRNHAGSPTRAKGKPSYIAHFVVRTNKYEETLDWYRRFFEAEDVFVSDELSFLTFDDEHHRIAIINQPDLQDFTEHTSGVDHVAFGMDSLGDLIAAYERLREIGIEPEVPINHGMTTSLYYADPNGVKIEMQVDNSSLPDGPQSYFKTEAFAQNPIGVMFDPEVLARKYHEGVDVDELLQLGSTDDA